MPPGELAVGKGPMPKAGSHVMVHYTDGYTEAYYRWDLAAQQKLFGGISVFLNVNNLTAAPDKSSNARFITLEQYYGWSAQVAASTGVRFVDLTGIVAPHYEKLGPEAVARLFGRAAGRVAFDDEELQRAAPDRQLGWAPVSNEAGHVASRSAMGVRELTGTYQLKVSVRPPSSRAASKGSPYVNLTGTSTAPIDEPEASRASTWQLAKATVRASPL